MISVVIPAFNEESQLGECLASLASQTIQEPFEVVVVDNNSTDSTHAVAEQFCDKLNLRVVREPRQGRGQARRTGFREAVGDILVSSDADTIMPPEWLATLTQPLEANSFVAVAGPSRLKDGPQWSRWLFGFLQPATARAYRLVFGHYWLPGFNFAIRREVYFLAGEFDADMDALEDNDLSWRVTRHGRIHFVPESKVAFSGRRFFNGFWSGMRDYVVVFVKYHFFKHRRIFWSNIR